MPWRVFVSASLRSTLLAVAMTLAVNAAEPQRRSTVLRADVRSMTHSLIALAHRHRTADHSARGDIQQQMVELAKRRQQLLSEMLAVAPANIPSVTLPARLRAALPTNARAYVEEDRELEGTLQLLYEDYQHDGRLIHVLKSEDHRIRLHFPGDAPTFKSGAKVRVKGLEINGEIAVESGENGILLAAGGGASAAASDITTAAALDHTLGEQRTLVLLANFQDDQAQPLTRDSARALVMGTVSQFIAENSQNQTWLAGDVHGWFTLPLSKTVCGLSSAGAAADQAAIQAGVNLSAYTRIIYVFTKTACNVSGMGEVAATPSRAYINGVATDLYATAETIAHELGHNFGLNHAHALDCGDVALAANCTSIEYGDTYDTMGNPDFGHFNAFHKERLGWMNPAGSRLVTEVSGDGAYTIGPYEASTAAPKALKIPRGIDPVSGRPTWLYVEYRQALGFDSFLSERSGVLMRGEVTRGVVVHLAEEGNGNSSQLLHMNLDSQARQIYGFRDWFDPALDVGAIFVDTATGLSITAETADVTGAVVRVSRATTSCVPTAPSVTASPAQASGSAGTRVTYNVTITNRDGAQCPTATYALTASSPSGWSAAYADTTVTLLPGTSTTTTLQVTSASAVPTGLYDIIARAHNAAQSTLAASAAVTYLVETSMTNSAPQAVDDSVTASSVVQRLTTSRRGSRWIRGH